MSLLQVLERPIDKISLQKLLFVFTQKQDKTTYDFIPYQYGCYSYSLKADIDTMLKKGMVSMVSMVSEKETYITSNETINYLETLKVSDRKIMLEIKTYHGAKSNRDLTKYTYIHFPYWAINSKIAKEILTSEQLEDIEKERPKSNDLTLFTIGYEGISLEEYLNRLIKNNVKVLIDVRKNPLSMKYGFSKYQLQKYCENLNIKYVHFPEVGIQSSQRQELNTQTDYDQLFINYREDTLKQSTATQLKILELLEENHRIALTCFEANINQCHRKNLAEAIENLSNFKYKIKHI